MAETKIVVGPQPFSVGEEYRGWRSVTKTVR
ncbi:molybdopterin converting factor subunit 2 [Escherichia coli]|uniref:Molybdopterin converting factor subunit 2 n=1 Tax=Escherichia coli TaxID=562 RepID=A0A2X3K0W9_ECOLX|nr:molybdopterin converting factor subunit 2 [Escherichia coli]